MTIASPAAILRAMDTIKVAQFGLGPIGISCINLAAEKPWIEVVGGVDIDPGKVGKTLAEVTGNKKLASGKVFQSFDALWEQGKPEVVFQTAGSKAEAAISQIKPMAERGV